jgi:hypothetical protein
VRYGFYPPPYAKRLIHCRVSHSFWPAHPRLNSPAAPTATTIGQRVRLGIASRQSGRVGPLVAVTLTPQSQPSGGRGTTLGTIPSRWLDCHAVAKGVDYWRCQAADFRQSTRAEKAQMTYQQCIRALQEVRPRPVIGMTARRGIYYNQAIDMDFHRHSRICYAAPRPRSPTPMWLYINQKLNRICCGTKQTVN